MFKDRSDDENMDIIYPSNSHDQTKGYYTEWADTYDYEFNAPSIAVKHLMSLGVGKEAHILDIGAGTGAVGHLLAENGYKNVDALDLTPKMLEIAKQRNCYNNLITAVVDADIRLPIEDNSYDAVIMAGCVAPGHIRPDAFEQIIRVVKPGGTICWSMSPFEKYADIDDHFREAYFSNHMQSLSDRNLWTFFEGYPIRVNNYYKDGRNGLVHAFKVI